MKLTPLHLFLVLLLGLLICSCLGTSSVMEGLEDRRNSRSQIKKNVNPMAPQEARDRVLFDDHTTIGANPLSLDEGGGGANPLLLDEGDSRGPRPIDEIDNPPQSLVRGRHHEHPLGIPRSQIPEGDEDLYILKSEIVPPVCPACPSSAVCPRQKPCPPCPPCARCPEPAFECKKVPNYRNNDDMYLPRPVLADFSQFGM